MRNLIKYPIVLIFIGILVFACKEKSEDIGPVSDEIRIISLEASFRNIKAWDTTSITVVAEGENLQYYWEANHGDIKGSGTSVKYAAGNCCIGMNIITCRVFNDSGHVEDTIQIRVRHYFEGK